MTGLRDDGTALSVENIKYSLGIWRNHAQCHELDRYLKGHWSAKFCFFHWLAALGIVMLAISITVGCGNCVEMAILSVWFFLVFFSFLGITSELFDEFAYWFLNYQPSFYYRTAIPLSILFHSILFPYISFQILFLWILFLMWAIYTYHCLYHFSLNVLLYVCFMYHYFVPCIYMYLYVYMYVYLSIYLLKVGD